MAGNNTIICESPVIENKSIYYQSTHELKNCGILLSDINVAKGSRGFMKETMKIIDLTVSSKNC